MDILYSVESATQKNENAIYPIYHAIFIKKFASVLLWTDTFVWTLVHFIEMNQCSCIKEYALRRNNTVDKEYNCNSIYNLLWDINTARETDNNFNFKLLPTVMSPFNISFGSNSSEHWSDKNINGRNTALENRNGTAGSESSKRTNFKLHMETHVYKNCSDSLTL